MNALLKILSSSHLLSATSHQGGNKPAFMKAKICNRSLPLNVCLLRRIGFVISHITENYTLYIGKAQRYNASVTEWTVSAMTSHGKMAPIAGPYAGGVRGVRTNPAAQLGVPFCSALASSLVFVCLHQSEIVVCGVSASVSVTL